MKLTNLLTATAVATLIAGGAAFADEHSSKGNAYGKYGCSSLSAPDAKTPGKWFKALKGTEGKPFSGGNPKEIQEFDEEFGSEATTVGEMISNFCGDPS